MKSNRLYHARARILHPSVGVVYTICPHKPHTTHSLRKVMTSTGGTALDMAVKPAGVTPWSYRRGMAVGFQAPHST